MEQCASDGVAPMQSLLKLPIELRLDIYQLVLSTIKAEEANKSPITFTVAQHKARREPCRRERLNIFKLEDNSKDHVSLCATCVTIRDEIQQHLTPKIAWCFDLADILSCFLGTKRLFDLPATTTETRIELLRKSNKVVIMIPEWDLWNEAPVELTRLGTKLAVSLSLEFVDQIDKGVESRGLVAAVDCWKSFA
jgi:hypothetical protein